MQDDTITAAFLDFGSHSIKAALADCKADGSFVLGQNATADSEGQIRRGIIYNLKEVATKTDDLLRQLAQLSEKPISVVYAGVNGQSLHSVMQEAELSFPEPREIREPEMEDLSLRTDDEQLDPRYVSISDDITPIYYVDGSRTSTPTGVVGKSLKVCYQLLVARQELNGNMQLVLEDKLSREAEYLIPATIMSDLFLTTEQKLFGCALIDFGGGCTTVSVYNRGQLIGLRVFPLGGDAITADLTDMHISLTEAERIKTRNGSAFPTAEEGKKEVVVQTANGMTSKSLSQNEVNRFIRARATEIVRNISTYINTLLPEHSLSGIVISGGGSRLNGLRDLLTKEFNVKVDFASAIRSRFVQDNSYYVENPEWHAVYSMAHYAAQEFATEYAAHKAKEEAKAAAAPKREPSVAPVGTQASATEFPEDALYGSDAADKQPSLIDLQEIEEKKKEERVQAPPKRAKQSGKSAMKLFGSFFKELFPSDDLDNE